MYDIPRENHLCIMCNCNEIGDEFHHSFVSLYLSEITKTSEVFYKTLYFYYFHKTNRLQISKTL